VAAKWQWSVPRDALRKHGDARAADRIWARLEEELPATHVAPRRRHWAPLAVAASFAGGVWVGASYFGDGGRIAPSAALHAEPLAAPARPLAPVVRSEDPEPPPQKEEGKRRSRRVKRVLRTPASVPTSEAATAQAVEVQEEESLAPTVEAPVAPPPWQALAEQGDYGDALSEIHAQGGFDTALANANSEQLMLLVDVARATGQRQLAIVALRRVVDDYRVDPLAPLAAWSLGVMLEKEGDRPGATAAYRVYRSLSPQGDFAEDALARQVRIALDMGDESQARALAQQYLQAYPSAPRAEEFQQWLDEHTLDIDLDEDEDLDAEEPTEDAEEPATEPEPAPKPPSAE